jgi:hypothetical protein
MPTTVRKRWVTDANGYSSEVEVTTLDPLAEIFRENAEAEARRRRAAGILASPPPPPDEPPPDEPHITCPEIGPNVPNPCFHDSLRLRGDELHPEPITLLRVRLVPGLAGRLADAGFSEDDCFWFCREHGKDGRCPCREPCLCLFALKPGPQVYPKVPRPDDRFLGVTYTPRPWYLFSELLDVTRSYRDHQLDMARKLVDGETARLRKEKDDLVRSFQRQFDELHARLCYAAATPQETVQ